uniref:DNA helicase Pif1-like 2B domain-containing protein n=1 Tax=Octopus bimaculoides TaxID=37653 RepID=A0A0L8HR90_OCTBM
MVSDLKELMNKVFPNLRNRFTDHNWQKTCAVLAPKNVAVDDLNIKLLEQLPVEFLNSLTPPNLPSHNLHLKIGAPVMLLRKLNPSKLCNGTRLIIKMIMLTVLKTTILTVQTSLKMSFAMSINKAQDVIGMNLVEPVFSHGQLYVGCSRVGKPNHLFIYVPQGKTKNVVYQETLQT